MKLPTQMLLTRVFPVVAILLSIFLRFYNFRNTLQFIGDQGRDAIIVLHMIKDHHPVLIGPVTSVGNMYLGPLYYYLMVPFLWLTYPSPLGPAYAVAVLSVVTTALMYILGKEVVGKRAALIASFLFATSATVTQFARFSWNPNPAPFFGLMLVWASYRFWKRNTWYLVLMSLCIAVLVQLHYVTLLAAGAAGILWLFKLRSVVKKRVNGRPFFLATLISVGIFLLSLTPLVLFDFRHNFLNFHALQSVLFGNQGFTGASSLEKIVTILHAFDGRAMLILFEMFIGKNYTLNVVLLVGGILFYLYQLLQKKVTRIGSLILLLYFSVAVVGLAFYHSTVFFHYIAYLFPISLLMYGVVLDRLSQMKFGKVLYLVFAVGFAVWNIQQYPFQSLSWTIDDVERASQTIAQRVKPGEKYNLVLLTATGDIEGQNYRYFLDTTNTPPLPQERWGETETLFIINEDKKLKRVVDSPIYEIVVFPNKKPAEVYTIPNGPEITVLRK